MQTSLLISLFILQPQLQELNDLAKARNVDALLKLSGPGMDAGTFRFLRQTGAFGVGQKGWTVAPLTDAEGKKEYRVFTSPLTSQDYGDQVFEWAGGKLSRLRPESEVGGYRVRHLDFDIYFIKEDEHKVRFSVETKLERQKSADQSALLRLGPNYKVQGVFDAAGQKLPYQQAGGVVLFTPRQAKDQTVKIDYEGVVNTPGFAGAVNSGEAMLTNDYWWPSTGRLPVTFTVQARTPESWEVITSGERTGVELLDQVKVTRYRMDVPIVYLSLSAGPFNKAEKKTNGIDYRAWSLKLTKDELEQQTELYPPIIEFYAKTFAPHPFTQYGAVDTELYGGGALEAYSYATYGHGWLPDEDAHEPAHTWFGGILPNTYLKSMWNESFAVWCESFYAREGAIGNAEEKRPAFVAVPSPNGAWNATPMVNSGVEWAGVASALGYGKGGFVLQQLEFEMGTAAIVAAARKWIQEHPKGEPAEWEGFEAACGPEWKWFFDQWHRRAGYPAPTVSGVAKAGGKVIGKVEFAGEPYRMGTELAFATPSGWKFGRVTLDGSGAFSADCPADATEVVFDPWGRLPIQHKRSNQVTFNAVRRVPVVLDEKNADWMPERGRRADWDGKTMENLLFVGHPSNNPVVADLCKRAGFAVDGDKLTYRGTTIDLRDGCAMALIDLGNGKRCGLRLGKVRREPSIGSAKVALTDGLGRFLRGETEPRHEDGLVFKL